MNRSLKAAGFWLLLPVLYIAGCAVIDFIPNHGAPNFRYTGSDPSQAVWNFGWPMATFIYDAQHGAQIGPVTLIFIPLQAIGLLLLLAILAIIHFARQASKVSSRFPIPPRKRY